MTQLTLFERLCMIFPLGNVYAFNWPCTLFGHMMQFFKNKKILRNTEEVPNQSLFY